MTVTMYWITMLTTCGMGGWIIGAILKSNPIGIVALSALWGFSVAMFWGSMWGKGVLF